MRQCSGGARHLLAVELVALRRVAPRRAAQRSVQGGPFRPLRADGLVAARQPPPSPACWRWNSSRCDELRRVERRNGPSRAAPSVRSTRTACRSATTPTEPSLLEVELVALRRVAPRRAAQRSVQGGPFRPLHADGLVAARQPPPSPACWRWNSSRCDELRRVERRNGRPGRPLPSAPRGRACRTATSTTCNKLRCAPPPHDLEKPIAASRMPVKLSRRR